MAASFKQAINQFRPQPTGNLQQDIANRQAFDLIHQTRDQFTPLVLSAGGRAGSPVPVATMDTGVGLSITLTRPGVWVIGCAVCLTIAADPSQVFTASLYVGRTKQPTQGKITSATDGTYMMHQYWSVSSASGKDLCRILVAKSGGTGTSSVDPLHSTMMAFWQGPIQS
jgi:hypothetical protein